jgi:hypothetical protein
MVSNRGIAMLYTYSDCQHETVVAAVETGEVLRFVAEIDTDRRTVHQIVQPIVVTAEGQVLQEARTFRSIYPIGRDRFGRPCLFHCYGEVAH